MCLELCFWCRHVRVEAAVEAGNIFLIRIKLFFITRLSSSQRLPCFLKKAPAVSKPGPVWFIQAPVDAHGEGHVFGPCSPVMATGQVYLAERVALPYVQLVRLHGGAAWASVLFCEDLQGRDAVGWVPLLPNKSLVSWAEGGFWAVCSSGCSPDQRAGLFCWVA